jgi:hypothetical protein
MNAPLRQASAADRPSGRGPAIERDVELDHKLAALLDALEVAVPPELRAIEGELG